MQKIIISIEDGLNIEIGIKKVCQVIGKGKISDYWRSYCYTTTFLDKTIVEARRNKNSHSFKVLRMEE